MENKKAYLYLIECDGYYKIGVSNNPEDRISRIRCYSPHKMRLIDYELVNKAHIKERKIHENLNRYNKKGEWFDLPCLPKIIEQYGFKKLLPIKNKGCNKNSDGGRRIIDYDVEDRNLPENQCNKISRSQGKLSEEQVKEIKRILRDTDRTLQDIADDYDVCNQTISKIDVGKTYDWVEIDD